LTALLFQIAQYYISSKQNVRFSLIADIGLRTVRFVPKGDIQIADSYNREPEVEVN